MALHLDTARLPGPDLSSTSSPSSPVISIAAVHHSQSSSPDAPGIPHHTTALLNPSPQSSAPNFHDNDIHNPQQQHPSPSLSPLSPLSPGKYLDDILTSVGAGDDDSFQDLDDLYFGQSDTDVAAGSHTSDSSLRNSIPISTQPEPPQPLHPSEPSKPEPLNLSSATNTTTTTTRQSTDTITQASSDIPLPLSHRSSTPASLSSPEHTPLAQQEFNIEYDNDQEDDYLNTYTSTNHNISNTINNTTLNITTAAITKQPQQPLPSIHILPEEEYQDIEDTTILTNDRDSVSSYYADSLSTTAEHSQFSYTQPLVEVSSCDSTQILDCTPSPQTLLSASQSDEQRHMNTNDVSGTPSLHSIPDSLNRISLQSKSTTSGPLDDPDSPDLAQIIDIQEAPRVVGLSSVPIAIVQVGAKKSLVVKEEAEEEADKTIDSPIDINHNKDHDDTDDKHSIISSEQYKQQHQQPQQLQSTSAPARSAPAHLHLNLKDSNLGLGLRPLNSPSPSFNKPLPKSPSSGSTTFAAIFGWAASSPSPSQTDFSPLPTPVTGIRSTHADDTPLTAHTPFNNSFKTINASSINNNIDNTNTDTPPPPPLSAEAEIEEMEDELKGISTELAASIRREMDLEDLVDRLQSDRDNGVSPSSSSSGKRTSDYFSDSGYGGSARSGEYDQTRDELEKIQRRAEQEKAQIRLELTTKLQDERARRKELDRQIGELSLRAARIDLAHNDTVDASDRIKDLEKTCEDLRRKLSEEREVKGNYEDLLTALKGDLRDIVNERDNLRDEIVPNLRSRVEGLEVEALEHASLTYESSKMQQEIQNLQEENAKLKSAPPAIERSNSVVSINSNNGGLKPNSSPGLSRSNSLANRPAVTESREGLVERLKDVESQRDALHNALRNLLDRQEFQNRENERKIKMLEAERDRLIAVSPRSTTFEREVSGLRSEIKMLRRRAEDALEQKWHVEKGLSGLQKDLDRAEQEIDTLRSLLNDADIAIPASIITHPRGSEGVLPIPVVSESLRKAYSELQKSYGESIERIKKLQDESAIRMNEETKLAVEKLEQSLQSAVQERNAAREDADALRDQLASTTNEQTGEQQLLSDELQDSVRQVEELAGQVRNQLASNANLRNRLAEMVARGDADRKSNIERINSLQERLRSLEDQVVVAQHASEESVTRHQAEIAAMQESHSQQLQRARSATPGRAGSLSPLLIINNGNNGSLLSPSPFGLASPGLVSPRFAPSRPSSSSAAHGPSSPHTAPTVAAQQQQYRGYHHQQRISTASSVGYVDEEVCPSATILTLRARVAELEAAVAESEAMMQQVVSKMSAAQIEVMTLRDEKEEAERQTRKLQRALEEEATKAFEQRFRSLGNMVVA